MKPLIAVTTWKRYVPTFWDPRSGLYTLSEHYVEALHRAGAVPLMLADSDPEDAEAIVDAAHGLLLTGGGDIDPRTYGEVDQGVCIDVNPKADVTEQALLARARDRQTPVLGICRGMQMMNVASGGTMRQHIITEDGPHLPEPKEPEAVKRHGHDITITPGTRLADLYGTDRRWVNSYHHQAVDRLAPCFDVTARAADGVVEAIEHRELNWLGVQWHPEKTMDGTDDVLFAAFVESVRQSVSASLS